MSLSDRFIVVKVEISFLAVLFWAAYSIMRKWVSRKDTTVVSTHIPSGESSGVKSGGSRLNST